MLVFSSFLNVSKTVATFIYPLFMFYIFIAIKMQGKSEHVASTVEADSAH